MITRATALRCVVSVRSMSTINWHGKDIAPDILGWFADKVCLCTSFKYRRDDLTWPEPPNYAKLPSCAVCDLPDRQLVMQCAKCQQLFYRYFSHPRNGFYHNTRTHNPVGWFCYSCLENDLPGGIAKVNVNAQKARIAPISEIVPPNYRHAEKRTYDSETAARLAKFKESLKGI